MVTPRVYGFWKEGVRKGREGGREREKREVCCCSQQTEAMGLSDKIISKQQHALASERQVNIKSHR